MHPFKKLIKLSLPLGAFLFVACSPQKKVQQYSYLVKHKAATKLLASTSTLADPNLRPPISTNENEVASQEIRITPKASVFKKHPKANTNPRKALSTEQQNLEEKYFTYKASNQEGLPQAKTEARKDAPIGQTDVRKDALIPKPVKKKEKPISKTEVKESIDVSIIEAPKASPPSSILMPESLKEDDIQKVVNTADQYLGTPYKYAGINEKGIDCSGLICQAYSAADITLPRNSWAMAKAGQKIPIQEVAPGHLLFFHSYKGKGINHVAMVSKVSGTDIEFIHATVSNGVRKDKLSDPYWRERFRMAVVPTPSNNKSTAR